MTITSGELFKAALRKCGGVIAEGEEPSPELLEDTRVAFNAMLDSWSGERLSVFSTQDQVLTWPAGESVQTVGPTGDLVGLRPVKLMDYTYFKDPSSGVSYGLDLINESQYNNIAVKTSTSTYPQVIFENPTMPDSTFKVYPVPSIDLEFHLISTVELSQVDDLFTDINLPPGYRRALIFNLACEIAPELGIDPPATTQRLAMTSKRVLKRNNSPKDFLAMPYGILGKVGRFNIFSGNY